MLSGRVLRSFAGTSASSLYDTVFRLRTLGQIGGGGSLPERSNVIAPETSRSYSSAVISAAEPGRSVVAGDPIEETLAKIATLNASLTAESSGAAAAGGISPGLLLAGAVVLRMMLKKGT